MKRPARVSLKDIAARAGVTFQTVSAVLTDKPGARVSEAKRAEIRALAERLGYRPHAGARALIRERFDTLMLVQTWRGHPLDHLLAGVLDAARRHGQRLIVERLDDDALDDPVRLPRILSDQHADGLLINCNVDVPAGLAGTIARHRLPAVWLNGDPARDGVRPDDRGAARLATERLIGLGHRRIAWTPAHASRHVSERERLAGYAEAMHGAGLDAQVIEPSGAAWMDARTWDALAGRWAGDARRPTAVICSRSGDAQTARTSLERAGLAVPAAMSLLTFAPDPVESWGHAIATVLLPDRELGDAAVEMLLARIADGGQAGPAMVLPCGCADGTSLAPAPPPAR